MRPGTRTGARAEAGAPDSPRLNLFAEIDVLLGLASDELARVARVALEWHSDPGAQCDEQVAAILRSHGFRVDLRADRYESARGYAYAQREPDAGP